MNGDVLTFVVMIICGGAISLVFDFMRALHRGFGMCDALVMVSDILFCVIAAVMTAGCVWNAGGGQFRFYEIIGLFLGAVFYFLLLSKWILKLFLIIIENILKFTRFILKILLTPPQFLYKILVVPVHKYRLNTGQRSHQAHDERIQKQSCRIRKNS